MEYIGTIMKCVLALSVAIVIGGALSLITISCDENNKKVFEYRWGEAEKHIVCRVSEKLNGVCFCTYGDDISFAPDSVCASTISNN